MARILVVDDEPDIVRVVVKILEARGHTVTTGRDGQEALELVTASPPDVLVLDRFLPQLDGPEVSRRLKAAPATRHVPIVLMTSAYLGLAEADGSEPGADEYVVKPFVREVLIAQVERLLEPG